MSQQITFEKHKNKEFFTNICKIVYLAGSPNYWFENLDVSEFVTKIHPAVSKFINVVLIIFSAMEIGSFFTQKNLSEKQKEDLIFFAISHPVYTMTLLVLPLYKDRLRKVIQFLAVECKEVYNDKNVETEMIKASRFYTSLFAMMVFAVLFTFGLDLAKLALTTDATFTTVVTAWPDVNDHSRIAAVSRVLIYIIWCIFCLRLTSIFIIVIPTTICLSHQFKNLSSYFFSLNSIFEDPELTYEEKEATYEEGFKLGIKIHGETLWCAREVQKIFKLIFSCQITMNMILLTLVMLQMVHSDRRFSNVLSVLSMAITLLIGTGCFMWKAGDVTVEALTVPDAIYSSGWQNCRGAASIRVRSLLVFAMAVCQMPVTLRGLGIIDFSYSSYVTIVKSSYSVFSVLY